MISVVVVDDSRTSRLLIQGILSQSSDFRVVAEAAEGATALELVAQHKPDIVIMDVFMPVMDGFEATRRIMIECPTPIVIVTGTLNAEEVDVSMRALSSGALMALEKPLGPGSPGFDVRSRNFCRIIRLMSEVTVAKRHFDRIKTPAPPPKSVFQEKFGIVAIASSTGGPAALRGVLRPLPANFPLPIIVAQHISRGFEHGLARWLNSEIALEVVVASWGNPLQAGKVYISPTEHNLELASRDTLVLSEPNKELGFVPSANALFDSVAQYFGKAALAVILTGMGDDGSSGLVNIHSKGGWVIAQDEASSIVWSMPQKAIERGVVNEILPLDKIGNSLLNKVS